jgi:transposase
MWLVERLSPDFKTIADFRKDKGKERALRMPAVSSLNCAAK